MTATRICGIGTDLVSVARIAEVLAGHGDRFRARILTPEERREFPGTAPEARWLAKRWAAKEAAAKALGTGIGGRLSFQDIVVGREASGRPVLEFRGAGLRLAQERGIVAAHLSLSDERDFALAFVVLEGG
ncbi:MAG: holo-ACP synthase [Pseudomonadota bacterium]